MSTSRIPDEAGFVEPSKLPKGPRGHALCRKCGTECPTARNTFCSADCVHEWKLRTQPAYQSAEVLKRDAGVCASCGLDCPALLAELTRLRGEDRRAKFSDRSPESLGERSHTWEVREGAFGARLRELAMPRHLTSLCRRLWEMDHTVPVVEGGGACGLDNLRTLCWACHRAATRALAARRAVARKAGGG
jgi:5-methylcytosine-specific restriction endonuclease McrA